MRNLVVLAHPNKNSFCSGIVDTIIKASKENGDEVVVRDLYEIDFDPILKADDFVTFERGETPKDIEAEQEYIKSADTIIFVYPVWWASTPAIMQGYVDRVFSYGFAHEYIDGKSRGLLKNKRALLFSTLGNSSAEYDATGMTASMKQTKDEIIFEFCGVTDVKHVFFGEVPYVSDETRKKYLSEVACLIDEAR
ncbi:MAG: NAD(P)H-dependent oxidoreductase [Proteocatella sp.]